MIKDIISSVAFFLRHPVVADPGQKKTVKITKICAGQYIYAGQ